jgi:hypothetical protein
MKTTALSLAMLLVPAALCAQASGQDAKAQSRLESAQSALVAGGRLHPSTEEIVRGAVAMDHGVTKKQIAVLARSMADDRSLAVALDVVTRLAVSGKPVARAVAELQSNITSGASDSTLEELTAPGTTGTLTTAARVARRP